MSVTPDGAHAVNAPSGIARAEDEPTVQRVSQPRDAAAANVSRAIRLLPTPSAPHTRMPETVEAEMAVSMDRSSPERPINGHDNRTPESVRALLPPRGGMATSRSPTGLAYLAFLTFSTCLRSPSVAVSMPPFNVRLSRKPGIGIDRSIFMSNLTLVLSPSGVNV